MQHLDTFLKFLPLSSVTAQWRRTLQPDFRSPAGFIETVQPHQLAECRSGPIPNFSNDFGPLVVSLEPAKEGAHLYPAKKVNDSKRLRKFLFKKFFGKFARATSRLNPAGRGYGTQKLNEFNNLQISTIASLTISAT